MNVAGAEVMSAGQIPRRAVAMADVMRGIWRRLWWILATTAAVLSLATAVLTTSEPVFRTEAHVLVESLETPFDRAQSDASPQQRSLSERDIASQIEVLASRDLHQRVIDALRLTELPEVARPALRLHSRILIALGFKTDPRRQTVNQRALALMDNALTIYASPGSNVIIIRSSSTDAGSAAELANTLAEFYVGSTREIATDNTLRARNWLTEEIAKLREKVAASEAAAEQFRAENGLLKGTAATLEAQELTELSTQLTLAQSAKLEAQAKADSIKEMLNKKGAVDLSTAAPESSLMQRLREQQIVLSRQLAELSAIYLAQHPKMIALNRDIARLNDDIRAEAGKTVAALEGQAKAQLARETALRAKLEALMERAAGTNQDEVKLRALEREAAANRAVLETYLNRLSDANARVSLGAQPGLARIIQRADPPAAPSFPKRGPMLLLAGLAGLTIGGGLAFMASVMAEMAAPARTVAPVFPIMPARAAEAAPLILERPWGRPRSEMPAAESEITPAFCEIMAAIDDQSAAAVAASVLGRTDGELVHSLRQVASWAVTAHQTLNARRIVVSGPAGGEIASATMAVALARVLALDGNPSILVDADGRTDSVVRVLGIAAAPGLSELLRGKASFREACRKDPLGMLDIMQAGRPQLGGDVLTGPLMASIIEMLERRYSFVIVHFIPPVQIVEPWKTFNAGLVVAGADKAATAGSMVKAMRAAGMASAQFVRLAAPAPANGMNRANKTHANTTHANRVHGDRQLRETASTACEDRQSLTSQP
jgi:uncharacterized protein involved in exopolysaccharide biosynthesis